VKSPFFLNAISNALLTMNGSQITNINPATFGLSSNLIAQGAVYDVNGQYAVPGLVIGNLYFFHRGNTGDNANSHDGQGNNNGTTMNSSTLFVAASNTFYIKSTGSAFPGSNIYSRVFAISTNHIGGYFEGVGNFTALGADTLAALAAFQQSGYLTSGSGPINVSASPTPIVTITATTGTPIGFLTGAFNVIAGTGTDHVIGIQGTDPTQFTTINFVTDNANVGAIGPGNSANAIYPNIMMIEDDTPTRNGVWLCDGTGNVLCGGLFKRNFVWTKASTTSTNGLIITTTIDTNGVMTNAALVTTNGGVTITNGGRLNLNSTKVSDGTNYLIVGPATNYPSGLFVQTNFIDGAPFTNTTGRNIICYFPFGLTWGSGAGTAVEKFSLNGLITASTPQVGYQNTSSGGFNGPGGLTNTYTLVLSNGFTVTPTNLSSGSGWNAAILAHSDSGFLVQ
jgi:hypothetical protein